MNNGPSSENLHGATPQVAGDAASKAAKRTCIMVLGMHRSGTSALARAISLLGAELPKNTLGANPTNEKGHWEPQRLMEVNDRMLVEAGSRWDDWRSFDPDVLGEERLQFYRAEIARLIDDEYGSAPLFVLKEPRIARFVPLYMEIMERMGIDIRYVLIERNPLAVFASLAKRDGFTTGFSSLLWLRHEIEAENATRGQPRVFLSYETMLDRCCDGIDGITSALKIDWPLPRAEWPTILSNHFSEEYQHHAASSGQLEADPSVDNLVKQTYGALRALEDDPDDGTAMQQIDSVRRTFDNLSPVFADAFFSEISARERAAAKRFEVQHQAVYQQALELEAARAEAATLNALQRQAAYQQALELEAARAEAATQNAQLTQQLSNLRVLTAETQRLTAETQRLAAETQRLNVELGEIKNSFSWKVMYPVRYLKSLSRSDAGRADGAAQETTGTRK
jgi:hypothetical protein